MPQAKEQGRVNQIAAAVAAVLCAVVLGAMTWGLNWSALPTALGRYAGALGGGWQWPEASAGALVRGSIVFAINFLIGYWVLTARWFHRARFAMREKLALSPLVGMALWSGCICVGFNISGIFKAVTFLLAVIGIASGGTRLFRDLRFRQFKAGQLHPIKLINISIVGAVFIWLLPYAISPSAESDALRYHLGAPWQWSVHMDYLPWQAFSNFPFLAEVQFWIAMSEYGGGAKLLHFYIFFVSLAFLPLLARQLGMKSGTAGLALISIPAAAILACWGFIDMFLAAYFLVFVYVGIRAIQHPHRWGGMLLAFTIGGALGLKYTMLPLMGLLGITWTILYAQSASDIDPVRRNRAILLAGIGGLILGSPWYLRNSLNIGHVFYPLTYGESKYGNARYGNGEWSAANAEFYMAKAAEKGVHLGLEPHWLSRLIELIISPLATTFRFQHFEQHIIGVIPLFAVIVLLIAFIAWLLRGRPGDRTQKLVWAFASISLLASWLLWFFTYQSNRLLLPSLALAIAMAAPITAGWMRHGPRWVGWAVRGLGGGGIALGLAILIMLMGSPERVEGWKTGLGFQRPEIYLASRINYYEAAHWASRNLADPQRNPRILLIGEHRGMYWDIPTTHSDWFDTPQPLPWIRMTEDNDAMLDLLWEKNHRWIYLNSDELRLYHDIYFRPRFTAEEYARFEALLNHPRLNPIWRNPAATQLIFEIQPPQ